MQLGFRRFLVHEVLQVFDRLQIRDDRLHLNVRRHADVGIRFIVLYRAAVEVDPRVAEAYVAGANVANLQTNVVAVVQGLGQGVAPRARVRQLVAVQAEDYVAWLQAKLLSAAAISDGQHALAVSVNVRTRKTKLRQAEVATTAGQEQCRLRRDGAAC